MPDGRDAFDYLVELCEKGLVKRYGASTPELDERLRFELKTIREMGFADYFLIVADFIGFAKRNGVSVGPGRGSAAGSLAAYCLEITDIDPMRYGLLFERFLNPARKDMPDMDIDFAVEGRERVINYVAEKYGRDRVAQIITFSTMAARAALRDAGRVLEVPYGVVDRIAKLVPEGPGQTLEDALKPGNELARAVADDPVAREIVELARPLEGLTRADSIHAAGVVIGAEPLIDVVPLQQKGADAEVVTQLVDEERRGARPPQGRLPRAAEPRRDRQGGRADRRRLDIGAIPLDDRKTYEMLARADVDGRVPVRVVRDARRAAGREADGVRGPDRARRALPPGADAVHPDLRGAQERPGGRHLHRHAARADHRRRRTGSASTRSSTCRSRSSSPGSRPPRRRRCARAIGKKIHELMASLKEKFLDGCAANGVTPAVADQLWKDMESSQDYSFNKAHAACYALIAYRTAWLKANHPSEYMAALIS